MFSLLRRLKELTRRNALILLMVAFASASILILINYLTIKTLTALRAYTNGESQYSKGQKDAARNLILYVNTGDEFFWNTFKKDLGVPIADSLARIAMTNGASREFITKCFLSGRNHPDDIPNLIWLFENFHSVSFMKEAIAVWKDADISVGVEMRMGQSIYKKMNAGAMTAGEKEEAIDRINEITIELTRKEWAFESVLGSAARFISKALFLVNIGITFIIIGSSGTYAFVMVHSLRKKNLDLTATNQELDRFVYSASHDLRAPITSLKGMIEILKMEDNPPVVVSYLGLMEQSLNKQDQFIRDIIDFSRNKRQDTSETELSLKTMIEEVVAQHRYMDEGTGIRYDVEIAADTVKGDPQRLSIILCNLVSNAIKYSDPSKNDRFVKIKTSFFNQSLVIEAEDNGIGIRRENLDKIFEMFFVTEHSRKGSGLGLYITRETIEKLNGTVTAASEFGIGTLITVKLPLTNGNP